MAERRKVSIDRFQDAIAEVLQEYGQFVADVVLEKAVHETAEETAKVIAAAAPVRTGAYKSAITSGYPERKGHKRTETVYADAPAYRLTHLLERGHALRSGGRTSARPHWQTGDDGAADMLARKIKEAL